MATINPKFDEYIAKSQPFAQPVLLHLRKIVHKACPEVVEEIKWSFPNFSYKRKIICSMAAFKEHCSFGFWQEALMKTMEPHRSKNTGEKKGMGSFGRIISVKELPTEKELITCIKEAMSLINEGYVLKKTPAQKSAELPVPEALQKALAKNKQAKAAFVKLAPSHRKEYIQWINEAKTEATRDKRIATTIEWVSEGKRRQWQYERPKK